MLYTFTVELNPLLCLTQNNYILYLKYKPINYVECYINYILMYNNVTSNLAAEKNTHSLSHSVLGQES